MARSEDYKIDGVIVSFADNLFTARASEAGKAEKYGCTLLIDKARDLSAFETLIMAAAESEWPGKAAALFKEKVIKSPFLDGDGPQAVNKETGVRHKGYAGKWFIRCTSGLSHKPAVVDRKVIPIVSSSEIPSGSVVNAVVHTFPWTNDKGGKGITFGVSMVQLVRKAEGEDVLGGGGGIGDPKKHFEKLADEGEAPAATKTGAGASGLFG